MDIPKIPLEDFEIPEADHVSEMGIKNEYVGSIDFGVIGSGQGGGRIAKSFYDLGYKKSIAMNTAVSDLNPLGMPEENKLKIGDEGSGKDMVKGEKAAKEAYQKIFDKMRSVFGVVDRIVICAGIGGGSGAGSLQTLIAVAQAYLRYIGNAAPETDIIIIAALPTAGELRSSVIAKNTAYARSELFRAAKNRSVGPILMIDNSRIEKLYRGIPPAQFWPTINSTITALFQMFNYISTQHSDYSSFDSEDYKSILRQPGLAVMGVTKVDMSAHKLSQALQDNIKKTLLCTDTDYTTAKLAGCIVIAGEKVMHETSMDEISYGFDTISNLIGNATVFRGLYEDTPEGVRAYTLITGMSPLKEEK